MYNYTENNINFIKMNINLKIVKTFYRLLENQIFTPYF